MKKIKSIILTTILGLSAVCLTAQNSIRNYVGVVREQFYPNMVKFFEEYRDELKANGYSTYSKYVDSYLQGTFGSGFIYVADDGTNYVITNRHVVSQAATASIEFENPETGSVEKYEDLKVFATDDDIDVAILKFADGKNPFKKGLTFASARVSDGADVWSAGFPGLGSSPLWQLGKGTVTNSSARIKELLDPSISTLIQHSAEVDGGNSGGPLIADFISKAKVSANSDESANERARKFVSALNDKNGDFTSIAKFISYETASRLGKKNFESALKYAPSKERSIIVSVFESSPIEGLRYAAAYQMWKKYSVSSTEGTAFKIASTDKKAESIVFSLKNDADDKTLNATFISEHGLWRIENVLADGESAEKADDTKKKAKRPSNGVTFDPPSDFDFSAGILKSLSGESMGFNIDFNYWINYFGILLGFEHQPYNYNNKDESMNIFNMGIALRIPICIGSDFCIIPCGNAGLNFSSFDSRTMFGVFAEAAIEFMLTRPTTVRPAIGIAVKYAKEDEFFNSNDDWGIAEEIKASFTNLKIYAKIAIDN